MIVVNAVGKPCPIPVIEAKKALNELGGPGEVKVIVSSDVARQNLQKMAGDRGHSVTYAHDGKDNIEVVITVEAEGGADGAAAGLVVVIGGDTMGRGDDEMGRRLMKSFLLSLCEVMPQTILFINTGVRLTAGDSPALQELRALDDKGVRLLSCDACDAFFGDAGEPAVGKRTTMLAMTEIMAAAHKLITI